MDSDRAIGLMNDMLWTCITVAGPLLAAMLVVGLAISVLQVATQLQEATLSYIPKLLVATALLLLTGSWMIARITDFARSMLIAIPSLVL
ncbi:flagellar biosynthetic protein FliQ [Sphingomonas hankookensis]|uniref:flagellar biosynthetic protein FliQ n=1 Tax=Sphingomonas hankookensis TaxID=563996 RepID=UPI001F5AEECB